MKNKELLYKILSILTALLLWECISVLVGMEMLLASPITVIKRLFTLIFENDFLTATFYSLIRILVGFLSSFLLGNLLAFISYKCKIVERLLKPYIITIKSVPVASFIILFLIWFSYNQLTVLISFLIAFPVIYQNTLQGLKSTDKKMLEVAKIYNIPFNRKLIYIYLPGIKSYMLSACTISIGMAWKAGVAAEVIGVVANSIGEKLYNSKIYFQNADLLAWTIVIVVLSIIMEKIVCLFLKIAYRRLEKL